MALWLFENDSLKGKGQSVSQGQTEPPHTRTQLCLVSFNLDI